MLKFPSRFVVLTAAFMLPSTAVADKFNLGRVASEQEVAVWDIDVRPDGQGLPEGQGSVAEGEAVFDNQCAACHGDFAEGNDRGPSLVGGFDTLQSDAPVKTLGSYWPYLSTAYDYIRRAMPFGNAQSLSADETYAVLAYLLYLNEFMDEDGYLSRENFTSFRLPNENGFVESPAPDITSVPARALCMKDCKSDVKILKRARVRDLNSDSGN